ARPGYPAGAGRPHAGRAGAASVLRSARHRHAARARLRIGSLRRGRQRPVRDARDRHDAAARPVPVPAGGGADHAARSAAVMMDYFYYLLMAAMAGFCIKGTRWGIAALAFLLPISRRLPSPEIPLLNAQNLIVIAGLLLLLARRREQGQPATVRF